MELTMEILREENTKVLHLKKTSPTDDLHEFLKKRYPDHKDYRIVRNEGEGSAVTVVHVFIWKDL